MKNAAPGARSRTLRHQVRAAAGEIRTRDEFAHQRIPTASARPAKRAVPQAISAIVRLRGAVSASAPSISASVSSAGHLSRVRPIAMVIDGEPHGLHQQPAVAQVRERWPPRDQAGRDQRGAGAVDGVQDRLDQREREHDQLPDERRRRKPAHELQRRHSGKAQEDRLDHEARCRTAAARSPPRRPRRAVASLRRRPRSRPARVRRCRPRRAP